MRYFISVNYEEPNPDKYESVYLSESTSDKSWTFNSGDFIKDWFDMIKHVLTKTEDSTYSMVYSSTVNHFIMDGAKVDSGYLYFDDNGKPYLAYDDIDDDEYYAELFVKEGERPTWEELKEKYK